MSAAPVFVAPTARDVTLAFCAASGFTYLQLTARRQRSRYWVQARQRVAVQLRELGFSYPEIGAALGGLHHTTVMYLCGAIPGKRKGPQPAP